MAQLIQPILDTFKLLLESMDESVLGALPAFVEVKSAGVNFNFPFAAVEPGRTVFDLSQDQSRAQGHAVVIQVGVSGSDPERLKRDCVAYAQAVDAAIAAWPQTQWPATPVAGMNVKAVNVASIEYSSTYASQGGLARFVDLTCTVEVEEWS